MRALISQSSKVVLSSSDVTTTVRFLLLVRLLVLSLSLFVSLYDQLAKPTVVDDLSISLISHFLSSSTLYKLV